jgi:hypothetical protein
MIEKFSPELCQHLSILVPGFEGHWWYVNWDEMLLRFKERITKEEA